MIDKEIFFSKKIESVIGTVGQKLGDIRFEISSLTNLKCEYISNNAKYYFAKDIIETNPVVAKQMNLFIKNEDDYDSELNSILNEAQSKIEDFGYDFFVTKNHSELWEIYNIQNELIENIKTFKSKIPTQNIVTGNESWELYYALHLKWGDLDLKVKHAEILINYDRECALDSFD